jgi:hypothetical protein
MNEKHLRKSTRSVNFTEDERKLVYDGQEVCLFKVTMRVTMRCGRASCFAGHVAPATPVCNPTLMSPRLTVQH